ncbi:spore germination protein GerPE [Metabacillus idriensis]|uniref:Spore germination protein GerPE n=1 Tax=Metabacillus idriensis TaxID=324768 RepID=A0A6I2M3V4_9BACI|nr:spore germination protein GerPE [Metabacillus idriensis]MCM3595325.1 spore germination protein GerPE [Metabacillus idriensis]MRX52649.1 spore germination protein GerPE [Metabacillus idriensis]
MINRLSIVNKAYVDSIGLSSIFQIGDSVDIVPRVKVYAVQREAEIELGSEGDLKQYNIYSELLPKPLITENIQTAFFHENPTIKVGAVKVTSISSSSVVHFGSSNTISAESRVKHIRQLLSRNERKQP